jgi:hypothetical protein
VFTNNNPVGNIEIGGRWWLTIEDKKKADQIMSNFQSMEKHYRKNYNRHIKKMNKAFNKGKQEKAWEYQNKAIIAEASANEMRAAQNELEAIENHSETFTFRSTPEGSATHSIFKEINDLTNDNVIVIGGGPEAKTVHELVHAYQNIDSQIETTYTGSYYVDIHDEVRAYLREFIFDPSSVRSINGAGPIKDITDINAGWVQELRDFNGDLLYHKLPYRDEFKDN